MCLCVKYKCQDNKCQGIVSRALTSQLKYFILNVGSAMSKKHEDMVKTRHSSMEMPDSEVAVKEKKKQDMLRKARDKFFDALKSRNNNNIDGGEQRKSRTQTTLNYLFKPCPNSNKPEKNQVFSNSQAQQNGHAVKRTSSLQKQHSVGAYPIKIEVCEEDVQRPATVCVDKLDGGERRETAALALERPRKKLSFREPEIMGYAIQINQDTFPRKGGGRKAFTPELKRSCNSLNHLNKMGSVDLDDLELESQAMRIVRTVGQAFEVCHKLSITAPETEPLDYDEQETLTQDLVSDRLSDVTSDKPKKDLLSSEGGASDKMSLPDENSVKDATESNNGKNNGKPYHLDVLSIPPYNHHHHNSSRKSPLTSGETYASPHSDGLLTGGSGSCSSSIPATGSALSAHHEIQLLREQLEQQGQQTQAALAQLQLAREQLAAEQSARLEAQARTHQLLVHNRELLDHIAALVAHLQGGEKATGQPQTSPQVTMPQQQQYTGGLVGEGYPMDHQEQSALDHAAVLQALGLNPQGLIENRAVTSCLPSSPLRTSFPSGNVFNYPHPQNDFSLEAQLLQRLQALCGYTPPQYSYNINQNLPFLPNLYSQPMMNNNYTLQPPPQKKLPPSPLAMRHSYSGSPVLEKRISPAKNDSLQNLHQAFQQPYQSPHQNYQSNQALNQIPQQNSQHLQVQSNQQQRQSPQRNISPKASPQGEPQFIKPLSQMGTLTTTDTEGRVRVIVPVPSGAEEASGLMSSLRLHDDFRSNVPSITRSTSEKVPNRSELMSQVQRTAWARHTTK